VTDLRRSAPPRTDPLAAALAFAVREAVRLEAERAALIEARGRANVVLVETQTETDKPEALVA
jgi:hypothetical protein